MTAFSFTLTPSPPPPPPPPTHTPHLPSSSDVYFTMAKSTRSKVKRAFRSKKRETGIYAATEAARLNRLNSKLVQIAKRQGEEEKEEEDILGWCWLATFGLLDPSDITLDGLESLGRGF